MEPHEIPTTALAPHTVPPTTVGGTNHPTMTNITPRASKASNHRPTRGLAQVVKGVPQAHLTTWNPASIVTIHARNASITVRSSLALRFHRRRFPGHPRPGYPPLVSERSAASSLTRLSERTLATPHPRDTANAIEPPTSQTVLVRFLSTISATRPTEKVTSNQRPNRRPAHAVNSKPMMNSGRKRPASATRPIEISGSTA